MTSSLAQNSAASYGGCISAPPNALTAPNKKFFPLDLSQPSAVYRLYAAAAAAAAAAGGNDSTAAAAAASLLSPPTNAALLALGRTPPQRELHVAVDAAVSSSRPSIVEPQRQSAFTACRPLSTIDTTGSVDNVLNALQPANGPSVPQTVISTAQPSESFFALPANVAATGSGPAANVSTLGATTSALPPAPSAGPDPNESALNLSAVRPPSAPSTSSTSSAGGHGIEPVSDTAASTANLSAKKMTRKELVRDAAYWERRRKNNDAAKRSRDSRRKKEDEVTIRAALLEQENLRLRFEIEHLKSEVERHRILALAPNNKYNDDNWNKNSNGLVVGKADGDKNNNNSDANNNNSCDSNLNNNNNNNIIVGQPLNYSTTKIIVVDMNNIQQQLLYRQQHGVNTPKFYCDSINYNNIHINNKNNVCDEQQKSSANGTAIIRLQ